MCNFLPMPPKAFGICFQKKSLVGALIKEVNESKSILVLNKGNLVFEQKPLLRYEIQWNSVNTGVVSDFNQDGM